MIILPIVLQKLSPDQAGIFHEDLFVFKYLSIQDVIQVYLQLKYGYLK